MLQNPRSKLTHLDLSMNQFEIAGMTQLSQWLGSEKCKLKSINLDECGVSSQRALELFLGFMRNNSLR